MNVDGGAGTDDEVADDGWSPPDVLDPDGRALEGTDRKSRNVYALRQRSSFVVKIARR